MKKMTQDMKKMTLREALGRFQRAIPARVESRIMTADEAIEKAQNMGLDSAVVEWISGEFTMMNERIDSGELEDDGYDVEAVTGESGRMALGQSWDSVQSDLANVMGLDLEDPEVVRVFDAFFEE